MPWEKQFDKDEVLDRAARAFWAGGYEATSMTDLLRQMGIQKGSFYATFGSKHQVLVDALTKYVGSAMSGFEQLHLEPSPRAALERHLHSLAEEAVGSERNLGCFLVNTALELCPHDEQVRTVVERSLATHEGHYRKLLESARELGEVPASLDPREVARGLLGMVLGMRVLGRSFAPKPVIESVRDQALLLLGNRENGN